MNLTIDLFMDTTPAALATIAILLSAVFAISNTGDKDLSGKGYWLMNVASSSFILSVVGAITSSLTRLTWTPLILWAMVFLASAVILLIVAEGPLVFKRLKAKPMFWPWMI